MMSFTVSSHRCVYAFCQNSRKDSPHLSFYKFPIKDKSRCKLWVVNCANPNILTISDEKVLGAKLVCEKHFSKSCFRDHRAARKFLTQDAVPVRYNSPLGKYSLFNL